MPEMPARLLDQNALDGVRIGLSASQSADLTRLGLMEIHFRLALAEIARSVLVSGGKLAYGGHLKPDGYTAMLIRELQRYSRRDKPMQAILAWSEHRRLALSELRKQEEELGLFGEIICLNADGDVVRYDAQRSEEPIRDIDDEEWQRGLTSLRNFVAENTDGRVLIGGRRTGFQGAMPGVLEEAVISLERGRPLYLVGGFGGITLDIIRAIDPRMAEWLPTFEGAPTVNERALSGLRRLVDLLRERDRSIWNNGLTYEENTMLAATHRPSEIAALVSLGMGRIFKGMGETA